MDVTMIQYSSALMNNRVHSPAQRHAMSLGQPLQHVWINAQKIARLLPTLLKETNIDIGTSDKIFSSQWLSETEILIGSKCNRLFLIDISDGSKLEIPRLSNSGPVPSSTTSCGIHSISISPGGEYVATGGQNPNYLALYSLPQILPLSLGEVHTDWIFDMQWISNNLLITGSRDSNMALWSITDPPSEDEVMQCTSNSKQDQEELSEHLAECVPVIQPIFTFSNLLLEPHVLATNEGERVRSMAYNSNGQELASLQANHAGANLHFWDAFIFQKVSKTNLPHCQENVCVQVDSNGTQLYAVGSRSHVTFIDPRQPSTRIAGSVKSVDNDSGVRSLQFNEQLLSVGTGQGHLYFYDMRSKAFLLDNSRAYPCVLTASQGWLKHDETYQNFFSGLPHPLNAIYTHCYSPLRTKLFAAGGPLPLGLCGNYASVWM